MLSAVDILSTANHEDTTPTDKQISKAFHTPDPQANHRHDPRPASTAAFTAASNSPRVGCQFSPVNPSANRVTSASTLTNTAAASPLFTDA